MKDQILQLLREKDCHVDSLGRLVIDNDDLLAGINGAMHASTFLEDFSSNTACANNRC